MIILQSKKAMTQTISLIILLVIAIIALPAFAQDSVDEEPISEEMSNDSEDVIVEAEEETSVSETNTPDLVDVDVVEDDGLVDSDELDEEVEADVTEEELTNEEYFDNAEVLDEEQDSIIEGEIVAVSDDEMSVVIETEAGDLIEVPITNGQVSVESSTRRRSSSSKKMTSKTIIGDQIVVTTGALQPERVVRGVILMYDNEMVVVKRSDTDEIETYRINTSTQTQKSMTQPLSSSMASRDSATEEEVLIYLNEDEEMFYVGDIEEETASDVVNNNVPLTVGIIAGVLVLFGLITMINRKRKVV